MVKTVNSIQSPKPVSRIAGLGKAIPDKILTNADFEKMVNTSDEWITARTGIKERHVVEPGTPNSELASEAARNALKDAGMEASDLDMIIVGTVTADMKFPSAAVFIQSKIGAHKAIAFDIAAACSGFLYGVAMADSFIRAGTAENILVIGSEILSSVTNYKDRSTCVLFGDGSGAAIVTPSDGSSGVLSNYLGSDGDLNHLLYCPGGGSMNPATDRELPSEMFTLHMAGNEVFKHAVKKMSDSATVALKKAGVTSAEIDLFVAHQANIRIIDGMAKRLKLPKERVFVNIHKYGNTSAASIPIALTEAKEEGKIKEGSKVLCVSFGAGFTWAAGLFQF